MDRLEAVEELARNGADSNKLSESNESALLLAVKKMEQTDPLNQAGPKLKYQLCVIRADLNIGRSAINHHLS